MIPIKWRAKNPWLSPPSLREAEPFEISFPEKQTAFPLAFEFELFLILLQLEEETRRFYNIVSLGLRFGIELQALEEGNGLTKRKTIPT